MESVAGHSARQDALEAWQRWQSARRPLDRDEAIFELWQLCEKVIWAAAKAVAEKFGGRRHVTVSEWRLRNGLTEEDVRYAAFPAVLNAAKGFKPDQGAAFQTYAYYFILGEISTLTSSEDLLSEAGGSEAGELQDAAEDAQLARRETRDMWYLLELDTTLDGPGRGGDLARHLEALSSIELRQLHAWLTENQERAIEQYGFGRWGFLHFCVGFRATVKEMPPEVRQQNTFDGMSSVGPLQGVTFRADGKKWDQMLPVQADMLLRAGLKKSAVAKQLDQPWSTFKDMKKRMEDLGFDSSQFTLDQTDAAIRGKQPGRPTKKRKT